MIHRAIETSAETAVDIPIVPTCNQSTEAGRGRSCHRLADRDVVAVSKCERMLGADDFEFGKRQPVVRRLIGRALLESHESAKGAAYRCRTRIGRPPSTNPI